MVSRLSGGRAGAWLAAVPVTVMAAVLGLVVPAASAAPASRAADAALVTAAGAARASAPVTTAARHRTRVIMLTTRVRGLHVRSHPSNRSALVAKLGRRGTRVTITCWTKGTPVVGNPVWYHLSGPRRGYVTSYYINTRIAPYPGLARCQNKAPAKNRYSSLTDGVRVRTGPSSKFRVLGKLGHAGSKVTVTCWTSGEAIWGDHAWYRLSHPRRGYTAGFHLDTGRDPARGVPHC
jgi:Bacterial SH3 domain